MQEKPASDSVASGDGAVPVSHVTLVNPVPADLAEALGRAERAPDVEEVWDHLEEVASRHQRPEEVQALYASVLGRPLAPALAERLGTRAVRFHDEWSGESGPLTAVLGRLLEIDPGIGWAFERLSMIFTVGERWDELLSLYDRALVATGELPRRRELLDEAAHVAKDFANQPDRAIAYLDQLFQLRPQDAKLAASLERLLEARDRYADLVRLWTVRLGVLPHDAAQATRARIAACWLDNLNNPAEAVEALLPLLQDRSEEVVACQMLERVAALEGAPPLTRRRALSLVRERYAGAGRTADVIRLLAADLALIEDRDERIASHRALGQLLRAEGRFAEALGQNAALLRLDPNDRAAEGELADLSAKTGEHAAYADALAAAADGSSDGARAVSLRIAAAEARCERAGDAAGGTALYLKAFWAEEIGPELSVSVGEKLAPLLEQGGRAAELVDVIDRLASLPGEEPRRCELLGRVGSLSAELGDLDRALGAWEKRLALDPTDREAVDARITLLERMKRWEPLLAALEGRAQRATSEQARREDLVHIAKVVAHTVGDTERAIAAWRDIEQSFGRSPDSVDALTDLLAAAGKWDELGRLLEEAVAQSEPGTQRADLLRKLGDLQRGQRNSPDEALISYRNALTFDAANEGARAGLRALVTDADWASLAVEGLVLAFTETDEWRLLLELLEDRLRLAPDDAARAQILMEAAGLEEGRAEDPTAALRSVGRAFSLAPASGAIEDELSRLSASTGDYALAVGAYARAIEALPAGQQSDGSAGSALPRAEALRFTLGGLLETRIGDLSAALDAYREVHRSVPSARVVTEALVRVSARLAAFDDMARALLSAATQSGAVDASLLAVVEQNVAGPEAWDAAVAALAAAIEREGAALPSAIAHALERQLGVWHRDQRKDPAAAERALARASAHDPRDAGTLRLLAELQRRAPGRPLVDTLVALSRLQGGELRALHEASIVALDEVNDQALGASILEEILQAGGEQWQAGATAEGGQQPEWFVSYALDRLVRVREASGEFDAAVQLLISGAAMPFERPDARALLHRAAQIAATRTGDAGRAVSLYRAILAEEPADARAMGELSALFGAEGRHAELVELRRHELGLSPPLERRLTIRIDIARLSAALGDQETRVAVLHENLVEQPGHEPSMAALSAALEGAGRYRDLADALCQQARTLESSGHAEASRAQWTRAADIAERHLGDLALAVDAHRHAVAISPAPETLDALGRLHLARGEPGEAVAWLDQRLASAGPEERTQVVLRLSSALVGAGSVERARGHLESELAADPRARPVRQQLAQLYRSAGDYARLVQLSLDAVPHETETSAKIALFLEAADIQQRQLHAPEAAVSLLREAAQLSPQDRSLRTGLADALRGAGKLDEAKTLLESLIEEYGRRRPPERAGVHFQLAQLAQARGDTAEALSQLDTASGMDMTHAGVLRLLGDLSREGGQLERAERAYRALLLTLRRQRPEAAASGGITQSEVLLELFRLSTALGQSDRAAELLESAFETGSLGPQEAAGLERALRASGDRELLLRSLESRQSRASGPVEQAAILGEIAQLLESMEGRAGDALEARLSALRLSPESEPVHAAVIALAGRLGAAHRYAERLEQLAQRASDEGRPALSSELWLRLGALLELSSPQRALAAYASAEATGERVVEALSAVDRVSGAVGDRVTQMGALRRLSEASEGAVAPAAQIEILYRLAEIELSSPGAAEDGVNTLGSALDREPQLERAAAMLRRAAGSADAPGVLGLYERVARASGSAEALLDALERLSARPFVSNETLREGVEVALGIDRRDRAEALLRRAIERAEDEGSGLAEAVWALEALGEQRLASGDPGGAAAYFEKAAEAAPGDEAFRLRLRLAALAAGPLADLPRAASAYEALLERDPSSRSVWEPLLDIYRRTGDEQKLDALIARAVEIVTDPADRRRLRMERVELLLGKKDRQAEAVPVLEGMLDEDPDDRDASDLLAGIFTRTGRDIDLAALLARQLEALISRGDREGTAALALRLGELLARTKREEAMDVYRRALSHVPGDRRLLRELLALFSWGDDNKEQADLMEELLGTEQGQDAASLALQLAELREGIPDDAGFERALTLGLAAAPESEAVRGRLERWYSDRRSHDKLVKLLLADADRQIDPPAQLARLRKAAGLQAAQLNDPRAAVDSLRKARALAPEDVDLLGELTQALSAAGENLAALAEVTSAIDALPDGDPSRPRLLRIRAALLGQAGTEAEAVADLERALELGDQGAQDELIAALDRLRQASAARTDRDAERAATLRLASLLPRGGGAERGRQLLWQWVQRFSDDTSALRLLLSAETAEKNWPAVIQICGRLAEVETDDAARIDAVLALADACAQLGQPEGARAGLELAHQKNPSHPAVRDQLRKLYELIGARRELATLYIEEANDTAEEPARFEPLKRAAELLITSGDPGSAIAPLEAALQIRANDHEAVLLLADAYIGMGQLEQATAALDAAIAGHKGRRSRELGALQHRMARVAYAAGDRNVELAWLNVALESDIQNGQVASELAEVSMEVGQYDLALKALRAVTMLKSPGPMSKAMAYLRQGMIAYHQGDPRKAVLLAKKAQTEDPNLPEAKSFLEQIGG